MSEIPTGEFNLKLGTTFTAAGKGKDTEKPAYHTLRYDFKPQSVSSDTDSFIAIGSNGDVQVVMPTSSDDLTVFKGSQKAVKAEKECLLFFDPATGTIRLEKLNSNITVKKTRDQESMENLRAEVERLRTPKKVAQEVQVQEAQVQETQVQEASKPALPESDSSDSSSDDDSSSSSSSSSSEKKARKSSSSSSSTDSDSPARKDESNSDDELSRALEDKILAKDDGKIHDPFADLDQPAQVYKPAPVHKSKTKDLMHDLQLSESSDED